MSHCHCLRALGAAALLALPSAAAAQTDYYNTDRGRPFRTEDAYPVEARAFELQAAPLRLERAAGGTYRWSVEPELAFGIMPGTQLEVGVPLSYTDASGGAGSGTWGVGGVHASLLHNLNVETAIPAFAIAASALLPAGNLAPHDPYFAFRGIMTRTFTWLRFHLNGEYTIGDEPVSGSESDDVARWTAGVAMDHTFPLRSLLVGAEFLVQQPLEATANKVMTATAGGRYQLTPRWALDAGVGSRLTGNDRTWFLTFGSAYAFGLPWQGRSR